MKEIKLFEEIIASAKKNDTEIDEHLAEFGVLDYMGLVFDAYRDAKECDCNYITIACHLRDDEMDPFLNALDKVQLTEFAVTNTSTALMDMLMEFQKRGWKVRGLEEVPTNHYRLFSKGKRVYRRKPAIIVEKSK